MLAIRLRGSFVDNDGSIFETDIDRIAAAGVIRGCNPRGSDRYCPDDDVIRGAMAGRPRRVVGG